MTPNPNPSPELLDSIVAVLKRHWPATPFMHANCADAIAAILKQSIAPKTGEVERVWVSMRDFVMPNSRPLSQHFEKAGDQIAFCHAVLRALAPPTPAETVTVALPGPGAVADVAAKLTKAQVAALLAAFRFIDNEAGIINGVPNEPVGPVVDPADDIALELADAFGIPFDECWPQNLASHLSEQGATADE